jgi:2-oxoglutarate ferredoxin oxidoreductase subunit beta
MTSDVASVKHTKKAIKNAFEAQVNHEGFSMVEILSSCNVGWKMSPLEALNFIKEDMQKVFPLGVFKERNHE